MHDVRIKTTIVILHYTAELDTKQETQKEELKKPAVATPKTPTPPSPLPKPAASKPVQTEKPTTPAGIKADVGNIRAR